jgi:LuxR family transcriptional regulator, maltose regulon positive regulatory protein
VRPVARPFRFQPPSLPDQAVVRTRLLDQAASRWQRRLITVTAGPGFGKTMLLAAATAEEILGTRDVWLTCEPADESAEHLLLGLSESLALPSDPDVGDICASIWASAPEQVCLVLDDVHEVPSGSPGAAVLARLLVDLPANGHVLLASREAVPVPTARLAAGAQLLRVGEGDLLLDDHELVDFAVLRDIDPSLLRSTGGWPALAELVASAGADLVPEYLWEEVLAQLGDDAARRLALFAAVGGGDDEVATTVVGDRVTVAELVGAVPLVGRSSTGWAVPHPLWGPALRPLLTGDEEARVRQAVAAVHRRRGRLGLAVDLLVENEDWDEVLAVVREAAMDPLGAVAPFQLRRWARLTPPRWHEEPEALLAAALECQTRAPLDALAQFRSAAERFRSKGDVDGELTAIAHEGRVRWWSNDVVELLALYERVEVLAAEGWPQARQLGAVGLASIAHLGGDSAQVLQVLAGAADSMPGGWHGVVCWLRSAAHRRNGDLVRAREELAPMLEPPRARFAENADSAMLHISWLEGEVDRVRVGWPQLRLAVERQGDRYVLRETILELACKTAMLGELQTAEELLATAEPLLRDMPGPLARLLRTIATAALAVGNGDEGGAASLLREHALPALGGPESWYWRDRLAIAMVHVLVPESRAAWAAEPLGPPHRHGLVLAHALEAAREGDLEPVAELRWPAAGIVRAHLPLRWVVELVAAGCAAGNGPPAELLAAVGADLRPLLRALVDSSPCAAVVAGAAGLLTEIPVVPTAKLRVGVLGPLELRRDGDDPGASELRRQRVRELLCYLVVHRQARREAVAGELWPDLDDGGRNLRVTLSYLQRALQPDRPAGEPPYFVRADGPWLTLVDDEWLTVDAWELDVLLDEAEASEREGAPARALQAYRTALPLWRGEPLVDAPYAAWAEPERARMRSRYAGAAVRAGELLLAAGAIEEARQAGGSALTADPFSEPAHRLVVRTCLEDQDVGGAHRALAACRAALATLDLEPELATVALLA